MGDRFINVAKPGAKIPRWKFETISRTMLNQTPKLSKDFIIENFDCFSGTVERIIETVDLNQLYVVGNIQTDTIENYPRTELFLLYKVDKPRSCAISQIGQYAGMKFRLFWVADKQDLETLIKVLHYSSINFENPYRIFSLFDLCS